MELQDPCMESQPSAARNYFLACYAVSLIQGQTILSMSLRHSTIVKYLSVAYKLFEDRELSFTATPDYIAIILTAVKNYEEVPKRRRMITDAMMQWLVEKASNAEPDSATSAIVDWVLLGRYGGFRSSEWCQTTQSDYARIKEWPGEPSLAFIRSDFAFLGKHEHHLFDEDRLCDKIIHHLAVKWRKQKNNQNGQKIPFADDKGNPTYSATRAGLRIYNRSLRLHVKDHEPMAVFKNKFGKTKFITDKMVTDLLRNAASAVLGLSLTDPEVKLWSTHSIRVTAANLLHRQHLSDSYIMTRLRWMSTSFLMYLRNTIYTADAHSKALSVKLSKTDEQEASYRSMEPHEKIAQGCALTAVV